MKRSVTLANGSRYVCKAIMFYYQTEENKAQVAAGGQRICHMVSIIFPDKRNSAPLLVIDCTNQITRPGFGAAKERIVNEPITTDQVGAVNGMFFVRVNHPSKLAAAAELNRKVDKVNISHLFISGNSFFYKANSHFDSILVIMKGKIAFFIIQV
jgi:hypothetical protein